MRIGELAKLSGATVETIRFYEKEGLLPPAARSENNYRTYGVGHLKRLNFVKHCRSLGISLQEIKMLTDVNIRSSANQEKVRALISSHLHEIDKQIEDLKQLRQHLNLLALCCKGHHDAGVPCGLIEGLGPAGACCHRCEEMKKEKRVTLQKRKSAIRLSESGAGA